MSGVLLLHLFLFLQNRDRFLDADACLSICSEVLFCIVIIYITSISIAGFNVMSTITSRKILNKKQSAH